MVCYPFLVWYSIFYSLQVFNETPGKLQKDMIVKIFIRNNRQSIHSSIPEMNWFEMELFQHWVADTVHSEITISNRVALLQGNITINLISLIQFAFDKHKGRFVIQIYNLWTRFRQIMEGISIETTLIFHFVSRR